MKKIIITILAALTLALTACQPAAPTQPQAAGLKVIAAETFLADIVQNVAGDRLTVDSLIPSGLDPHAFEPTPQDLARLAEANLLIINGAGFEPWLTEMEANAGGQRTIIEAAAGLTSRTAREGEEAMHVEEEGEAHAEGDPHFWLDPLSVITYVENIRDGLSAADPQGADTYAANAEAYIAELKALDERIRAQVDTIPADRRLIVTNHESFGYFADRYGFRIVGTIVPSVTTGSAPSAQQLASLVERIQQTGVSAIFLETGANPQLADQLAQETGVRVITDLYTHSITGADGPAPTYIAMMEHNARVIVEALR